MNAETAIEAAPLAKLREEFPPHQISKLPKPNKRDAPKGKCKPKRDGGDAPDWQDHFCGGYHGLPAVHLDYVGHAALTDRLLDTDPQWTWEPVSFDERGLPARDQSGGLWIKLTVCGVTRYGYGSADGKQGGDAVKELIGDALRNAAMRFGAALDLWHKGDLHVEAEEAPEQAGASASTGESRARGPVKLEGTYTSPTTLQTAARQFVRTLQSMGDLGEFDAWRRTDEVRDFVAQCKRDLPDWWSGGPSVPPEFKPLEIEVADKKRELEELETLNNRTRTVLDAG